MGLPRALLPDGRNGGRGFSRLDSAALPSIEIRMISGGMMGRGGWASFGFDHDNDCAHLHIELWAP